MNIPDEMPVLLHVCCAPCSGPIIEQLASQGIAPTIFFFNPNIHPWEEYEFRKSSVRVFAEKLSLPVIDGDYDTENWYKRINGMENEPEQGLRCSKCFDMRLERTAEYAYAHGFKSFATTNGIARFKDIDKVNRSGLVAAQRFPALSFWAVNWKENGGLTRITAIAKREHFYKQQYCGCIYSLKEANSKLQSKGFPLINYGTMFY
jgi:epoxyqueuosine reductase